MSRLFSSFSSGSDIPVDDKLRISAPRTEKQLVVSHKTIPRETQLRETQLPIFDTNMALNENNSNPGVDDFILIDNPVLAAPVENVHSKTPIQGGYVKILNHQPNADINCDKAMTKPEVVQPVKSPALPVKIPALPVKIQTEHEEALIKIEGFEPMLSSAFPDKLKQALLKCADPTNHHATQGKAAGPHAVLIKNAVALFDCFFHFRECQGIIGRFNLFALVGKACGLLPTDDFVVLKQYVGSVLNTLLCARAAFLEMNDGEDVSSSGAEDCDLQELIALVGLYTEIEEDGPSHVDENWCDHEIVQDLWDDWKNVVNARIMDYEFGNMATASATRTDAAQADGTDILTRTFLAAGELEEAIGNIRLSRGAGTLTSREKLLLNRVQQFIGTWMDEVKAIPLQAPADTSDGFI